MDDTPTARKRQRLEDELRKDQERVDQIKDELAKLSASGGEEGSDATEKARAPSLPTDVWTEVAKNLDGSDVLAFAPTSKQLRSAQQQAERMLVTMPIKEKEWIGDEQSTDQFPVYFTRSWCAWWSISLIAASICASTSGLHANRCLYIMAAPKGLAS